MSYNNFKPTFWSKHIQHELEKFTVMVEDCNRKFEGELKYNEKVKILGVGRPTLGDYTGADIGAPENVEDSSVYLTAEKAKYFNFGIDDVDKAQAKPGLMEALMDESSRALAEARDSYVASKSVDAGAFSTSAAITTSTNAKKAVDDAFEELWSNGVKLKSEVVITICPWFYNLFKDKLTELYTNNVELIRKGIIGMYNGAMVKLSNNLYNDGTDDYIMIRTKNAIAFASQIQKTEAYRPQGLFCDAVKGLDVYGAKVVRPKEMFVIKGRKA